MKGLGSRVKGLGLRVKGLGSRVKGLGFSSNDQACGSGPTMGRTMSTWYPPLPLILIFCNTP